MHELIESARKVIHNLYVMGFQVGPRRSNIWNDVDKEETTDIA